MCKIGFSFDSCVTGESYGMTELIDGENICSALNACVRFLHTMGFDDERIENVLGVLYFDEEMFDDLDAANSEAADEYKASQDAGKLKGENND